MEGFEPALQATVDLDALEDAAGPLGDAALLVDEAAKAVGAEEERIGQHHRENAEGANQPEREGVRGSHRPCPARNARVGSPPYSVAANLFNVEAACAHEESRTR